MVRYIFEITFMLVLVGLVLGNATNFEKVAKAVSDSYVSFVQVLQGR